MTSDDSNDNDHFTQSKLIGHKKQITCLESDHQAILISGSADKTCRIWDIKSNKTIKCIYDCFDDSIEAVKLSKDNNIIYVTCNNTIHSFDLRFDGLLSKIFIAKIKIDIDNDDISTISLNSRNEILAVAMDSGNINLIHIKKNGEFCDNIGNTRYKMLSKTHSNIINTICFHKTNPRELLVGGFDYIVSLWDIDRYKPKITTTFQLNHDLLNDNTTNNKLQILNPPFIMGLDYIINNQVIVIALGDGTIRLLNAKDFSLYSITDVHNCMVTALSCTKQHVITGGIDSNIYGFYINHNTYKDKNNKDNNTKKVTNNKDNLSSISLDKSFHITHTSKINEIISIFDYNENELTNIPNQYNASNIKLYIGDLTNDITLYSLKS